MVTRRRENILRYARGIIRMDLTCESLNIILCLLLNNNNKFRTGRHESFEFGGLEETILYFFTKFFKLIYETMKFFF